jgi:CubicO group peptidase (beta-lactamase class C family)
MNVRRTFPHLIVFLAILGLSCTHDAVGPNEPSWTLEDAYAIAAQDASLKCLIVYKDDHFIKEKYFHPGDSAIPHDVRSATKSIMSTLVGIAIDQGVIPSEEQTIGDYLRPLVATIDSAKGSIRIRDVLSMSSGLSGNDIPDVTEYNNWYNAPNQVQYTLNKALIHQPGQVFGYNTGASHLASVILTRAAGVSTLQFAKEHLFQPLGMTTVSWATDRQGYYNGGAALWLIPRDMLKIGQLYLNRGMYNGVRVVSEAWIDKASTFRITTSDVEPFGPSYGYLWWVGRSQSHGYFFANGFGGQFIVVVPDIRLIVVATNAWSNIPIDRANQQWYSTLDVIMNKILPLYE